MQAFALLSLLSSAAYALTAKGDKATYGFDTVAHPAKDEAIKAGSTFTIEWEATSKYDGQKLTINLLGGSSPGTLTTIDEVASGLNNADGSYQWHVKSSLGKDKVYGLQLISEKDNSLWQFSDHFTISKSSDDNNSATETETGSKSTSTATETGDNNGSTATESDAPKTTETDSASKTSTGSVETTFTTVPSKSIDASATGTETSSSTSSTASQTNAAVVLGSSNMFALGGVAAALFAL